MPIIYQQYLMALGIQEYTIELIGTNHKIKFSIGETEYFTTRFNKWEDFCYDNPDKFFIGEDGSVIPIDNTDYVVYSNEDGKPVSSGVQIVENGSYYIRSKF